jgi:hypothetical protein
MIHALGQTIHSGSESMCNFKPLDFGHVYAGANKWEWPLGMITILRPSGYAHHPRGRQQQAAQQEAMQRFMPRNDSVTVAWSFLFGLQRSTSQRSSTSTGLRSRRGHPRLEPDARTNRPIAQLAIYALALTRRVPRPEAL